MLLRMKIVSIFSGAVKALQRPFEPAGPSPYASCACGAEAGALLRAQVIASAKRVKNSALDRRQSSHRADAPAVSALFRQYHAERLRGAWIEKGLYLSLILGYLLALGHCLRLF
ncbi:MAG: hypothetical protein AB1813_02625 [Verrucomicrobiota bacterium]